MNRYGFILFFKGEINLKVTSISDPSTLVLRLIQIVDSFPCADARGTGNRFQLGLQAVLFVRFSVNVCRYVEQRN